MSLVVEVTSERSSSRCSSDTCLRYGLSSRELVCESLKSRCVGVDPGPVGVLSTGPARLGGVVGDPTGGVRVAADTARLALMLAMTDHGWTGSSAGIAALSVHPLDDVPVPSRAFEQAVRSRAREAAGALRTASEADAVSIARAALTSYKALAIEHGEDHYVSRFDRALRPEADRPGSGEIQVTDGQRAVLPESTPPSAGVRCSSCSAPVGVAARFCSRCGAVLGGTAAPASHQTDLVPPAEVVHDPRLAHLFRMIGVWLAMGASIYAFGAGLLWWAHALNRTGYRRRDIAMMLVPLVGLVVVVTVVWRYSSRSVYWSERDDRPSSVLNGWQRPAVVAAGWLVWPAVIGITAVLGSSASSPDDTWTNAFRDDFRLVLSSEGLSSSEVDCVTEHAERLIDDPDVATEDDWAFVFSSASATCVD